MLRAALAAALALVGAGLAAGDSARIAYLFSRGDASDWTGERTGATRSTVSGVDDYPLDTIELPFAFPFYGQRFQNVSLGANGLVQVYDEVLGNTGNFQPAAGTDMRGTILGFFTDLNPNASAAAGGSVSYTQSPEHLTVYFDRIAFFGCAAESVSFALRLWWNGRIACNFTALPSPATAAPDAAADRCALVRRWATSGVIPPRPDPSVGALASLPNDQSRAFSSGGGGSRTYALWAEDTEGVYVERYVAPPTPLPSALPSAPDNWGVAALSAALGRWELCPVSEQVCVDGLNGTALRLTFAELACDPRRLGLHCAFFAAEEASRPFGAAAFLRTPLLPLGGPKAPSDPFFGVQAACAVPAGAMAAGADHGVDLQYVDGANATSPPFRSEDDQWRSFLRPLWDLAPAGGGAAAFSPLGVALRADAGGGAALIPPQAPCDSCGVPGGDGSSCGGACGSPYSVVDCRGSCDHAFVEDALGSCCEAPCVGQCSRNGSEEQCCMPDGCDGRCGSFGGDAACAALAAGEDELVLGLPGQSLIGEAGVRFNSSGARGSGAALNISAGVRVWVEVRELVAEDGGLGMDAAKRVALSRRGGGRLAPREEVEGPAVVDVAAQVLWGNVSEEAQLEELPTEGFLWLRVWQVGEEGVRYDTLFRDLFPRLSLLVPPHVCEGGLTLLGACAWAPGCSACLLVDDVLESIAPIEQSAVRRLSGGEGRRLTLGDFPKVLVPQPEKQSVTGAVCIAALTPEDCDAVIVDFERGVGERSIVVP